VLEVDRLASATFEVERFAGHVVDVPRAPHRHDYHELLWLADGEGEQLVDGHAMTIVPGTVTVVARGQVHQFRHARVRRGALLRITDAALAGRDDGWLIGAAGRVIAVPDGAGERLAAVLDALRAETVAPPDPRSAALIRHLTATVLLWLERWDAAARAERPAVADDADVALRRRFLERLERDYVAHHDAAHYADALAVPQAALSRALAAATGRGTKELIVERVMTEAMRLLRFTDKSVGEVAYAVGYGDPLYFSRAFKRYAGRAPQAYREEVHGSAPEVHADGAGGARH
jgi:AraC family transcriptional regulator, transcriptional activator of pobA